MKSKAHEVVEALIEHASGLTRAELKAALMCTTVADGLDEYLIEGIKGQRLRFRYEAPANSDSLGKHVKGALRFYPMNRYPLETAKEKVISHLIRLLDSKDDLGRMSSPSAFASEVFDVLSSRHGYTFDEIVAALYCLISEEVVYFRLYEGDDCILFTLNANSRFTFFAYEADERQRYCFHVRAGNPVIGLKKIRANMAYHRAEVIGVCPGYIQATGEPRFEALLATVCL
jgi:hypothetical protein